MISKKLIQLDKIELIFTLNNNFYKNRNKSKINAMIFIKKSIIIKINLLFKGLI